MVKLDCWRKFNRRIKAHLEDLHFLQNELLCLQVIFWQNDNFLNRPLVCRHKHTPVSSDPITLR